MNLYHVGYNTIEKPDLTIGRKNADFGQGFYLSPDLNFSEKWAQFRSGYETILNTYNLDVDNLKIKTFKRDMEWFNYIYNNRNAKDDEYKEYDIIIGPIANDTIYNTWGILTSGLVDKEKSLAVLCCGNEYMQIVIKTNKALNNLKWITSEKLDKSKIENKQKEVKIEEEKYQELVLEILGNDIID